MPPRRGLSRLSYQLSRRGLPAMSGGMRFHKVNLEISNICNLQCSFCPEVIRDKKMMDPETFRRAIDQIGPLTEQVCLHLMGDPFVHPRLQEYLDYCLHQGVPVFLVTNGVLLLRPEKAALALHPAIRQLCFSLHSFPDNFPGEDPTQYLETVFAVVDRALVERPELYLNFRLWNLQELKGTGARNHEMLQQIEKRYGTWGDALPDLRRKKSLRLKGRLYLHFDSEFIWPDLSLPVLGEKGTCYGLKSHFGILADGTVVPCCLDKEGKIPLGNIRDQGVEEILASPQAMAILKGFQQKKLINPLCQRCQYITRFS